MPILPITKLPTLIAPGLRLTSVRERVNFTAAAASHALATGLPANSLLLSARLIIPATITAATATKIGFGRSTSVADPDKYILSAALTAATVTLIQNQWSAPLSAAEALAIFACDNAGAAAGTIGASGQFVDVEFTYLEVVPLG